jgi:hypothetical protein
MALMWGATSSTALMDLMWVMWLAPVVDDDDSRSTTPQSWDSTVMPI